MIPFSNVRGSCGDRAYEDELMSSLLREQDIGTHRGTSKSTSRVGIRLYMESQNASRAFRKGKQKDGGKMGQAPSRWIIDWRSDT